MCDKTCPFTIDHLVFIEIKFWRKSIVRLITPLNEPSGALFFGKGKENVEGRNPYSVKGLMDRCRRCGFSGTLMMPGLAFLGDDLNTESGHLLRVTHFISDLLSKLVQIHPFLSDLY